MVLSLGTGGPTLFDAPGGPCEPRFVQTLDTVVVRARNVRISGTVVDSATGSNLLQAQATLYPGGATIGASTGAFTFPDAPAGEVTLVVEALEHLPVRITFNATRDTSLTIALEIDPVGMRMIQLQVARLTERTRPTTLSLTALGRKEIEREGVASIGQLVTRLTFEDAANVAIERLDLRRTGLAERRRRDPVRQAHRCTRIARRRENAVHEVRRLRSKTRGNAELQPEFFRQRRQPESAGIGARATLLKTSKAASEQA